MQHALQCHSKKQSVCVLIRFVDVLLDTQYFLFLRLARTRTNLKFFRCVSKPLNACPCEKHGFSKFSPYTYTNWPCFLLVVTANASLTGNCKRLNSNSISVEIIGMRSQLLIIYIVSFKFSI